MNKENKENDTKGSILETAKMITEIASNHQYGHPKTNFENIARFWNAYLNNKSGMPETFKVIDSKDVSMMMTLLKIAREMSKHKRDNLVDAAGYIRTAAMIEGIE